MRLLLCLLFLNALTAFAQSEDLFDYHNSLNFARHLTNSGDYDLAIAEWERVYFLSKQADSMFLNLLKTYRAGGFYQRGMARFRDEYPEPVPKARRDLTIEFQRLLILSGNYGEARFLVEHYQNFLPAYRDKQKTGLMLIDKQYAAARQFLMTRELKDPVLESLVQRSVNQKHKSPWLSGTLSTLVPGLGKVYNGRWQDGLVAFLLVGANAFAAIRGFNQQGAGSVYGWIFASLGTAYYVSNIYGSVKGAQNYNQQQHQKLSDDVARYLYRLD